MNRPPVSEGRLLASLVDRCRRGLVTQEDAARLLGIRKSDLADLIAWKTVEAGVWRCYVSAFHATFPWCDSRLSRVEIVESYCDEMWRPRELENGDAWENRSCFDDRSPAHTSRAPPRETGWLSDFDAAA